MSSDRAAQVIAESRQADQHLVSTHQKRPTIRSLCHLGALYRDDKAPPGYVAEALLAAEEKRKADMKEAHNVAARELQVRHPVYIRIHTQYATVTNHNPVYMRLEAKRAFEIEAEFRAHREKLRNDPNLTPTQRAVMEAEDEIKECERERTRVDTMPHGEGREEAMRVLTMREHHAGHALHEANREQEVADADAATEKERQQVLEEAAMVEAMSEGERRPI